MANGELRLVGGLTVVEAKRKEKLTPKEKVASLFFDAFSVDTGEGADDAFEAKLAAAFRAVDEYNLSRGWRPPEKASSPSMSLSLFASPT